MIPASNEAFVLDAECERLFLIEQIEGKIAQLVAPKFLRRLGLAVEGIPCHDAFLEHERIGLAF